MKVTVGQRIRYKVFSAWKKVTWKLFLFKHSLPFELKLGEWSMGINDFEIILNQIKKNGSPKKIIVVELGSGVSTIIFGLFLKRLNSKNLLISFEKEEAWISTVEKMIKKYQLEQYVELRHVSYKENLDSSWFDGNEIENTLKNRSIDLVVVDAPPGDLCPFSRKPAIPFFLQYLNPEGSVVLHDTVRMDEIKIADSWSSHFREYKKIDTAKGIALFEGKKEISSQYQSI